MGRSNGNKAAKKRELNMKKAAKEGSGGGGSAGLASRTFDKDAYEAAQLKRAETKKKREEAKAKREKEKAKSSKALKSVAGDLSALSLAAGKKKKKKGFGGALKSKKKK